MESKSSTFGELLKQYRQKQGLTQEGLAELYKLKTGVGSKQYINNIETSEELPSGEVIDGLSRALEVVISVYDGVWRINELNVLRVDEIATGAQRWDYSQTLEYLEENKAAFRKLYVELHMTGREIAKLQKIKYSRVFQRALFQVFGAKGKGHGGARQGSGNKKGISLKKKK